MSTTLADVQKSINHQVCRDLIHKDIRDRQTMFLHGLGEEVGEVLGIAKRKIRSLEKDKQVATREHLVEELGDVLWYLTAYCDSCGITLQEIWDYNEAKLEERYGR